VIDIARLNAEHDAAATYREIRERGAVARSEAYGGLWALISYATVKRAATEATRFCSSQGSTIPRLGNTIPAIPVEVDPPEHPRLSQARCTRAAPRSHQEWEDAIRGVTDTCIDAFIERGRARTWLPSWPTACHR